MPELYELRQMQSLPLEAKVIKSQLRIREWYDHWDGQVYVGFSGGKQSTVVRDLVETLYDDVPSVFSHTGLEFPEIVEFVQTVPHVVVLRPRLSFPQVIDKYGYAVVSKEQAQYIYEARTSKSEKTRLIRLEGNKHGRGKVSECHKYLLNAPFKISDKCCDYLKKEPFARYERQTGRKPILGMMAADSSGRHTTYLGRGCNAFEAKRPTSNPIGFWTDNDVWEYIHSRNLPYSSIYDMGYTRTGCMFCCFGLHLEAHPNRFERMAVTHPKLFDYCMDKLGLAKVLDYMGVEIQSQFAETMTRAYDAAHAR